MGTANETATIPGDAVIVLVGPSGAGKDTWIQRHLAAGSLLEDDIVSSDRIRVELFGSDAVQEHHDVVFGWVHTRTRIRAERGLRTVVNATNLKPSDRASLLDAIAHTGAPLVAVRFDVDLPTLLEHNTRRESPRPTKVLQRHRAQMDQASAKSLGRQFDLVVDHDQDLELLPRLDQVQPRAELVVIGDVHGESAKFAQLREQVDREHPDAVVVLLGDLGDRGPDTPGAYRQAIAWSRQRQVLMVQSNHGDALVRKAGKRLEQGKSVSQIAAELTEQARDAEARGKPQPGTAMAAQTVTQFAAQADGERLLRQAIALERRCPTQLLLDEGRVVAVHGGITPETFGRTDGHARQVNLYGTPTGTRSDGFPAERDSWVAAWCAARSEDPSLPLAVYGHIAYDQPRVTEHTLGIDTGAGKHTDAPVTAAVLVDGRLERLLTSDGERTQAA